MEAWDNLNSDADLDNLRVKSVSTEYDPADHSRPFYEQLCLHLQHLENKGELNVAQDTSKVQPSASFRRSSCPLPNVPQRSRNPNPKSKTLKAH